MARYMLDTDTCSYIMKRSNQAVLKRLQAIPVTDVCMSVITKSELLYGVEVSPRRVQDATALQAFLPHVEVLVFPDDAAAHYAQIRAELKKRGQMIGANDLFIAAHARSLGLRLVTNNTAEFGRVKGLALENWTHPAPTPTPVIWWLPLKRRGPAHRISHSHECPYDGGQCRGIDGLGQILIEAGSDGALAVFRMRVGRHGRDWHTSSERRFDAPDLASTA